jgi:hypothetical protein
MAVLTEVAFRISVFLTFILDDVLLMVEEFWKKLVKEDES